MRVRIRKSYNSEIINVLSAAKLALNSFKDSFYCYIYVLCVVRRTFDVHIDHISS